MHALEETRVGVGQSFRWNPLSEHLLGASTKEDQTEPRGIQRIRRSTEEYSSDE